MLSEEEKKAIERLKLFEYRYALVQNDDKVIETILNLIKKWQREIEELKRKQTDIEKNYISKEKIDELSSKLFKEELKYAEDDDRTIPLIKMQNLLFHIEEEDWEVILERLSE